MVIDNERVAHLTKWACVGGAVGLALGVALAIGFKVMEPQYSLDDPDPFLLYLLTCAPALCAVGVAIGAIASVVKRAFS
jgi:hypothetical protein